MDIRELPVVTPDDVLNHLFRRDNGVYRLTCDCDACIRWRNERWLDSQEWSIALNEGKYNG